MKLPNLKFTPSKIEESFFKHVASATLDSRVSITKCKRLGYSLKANSSIPRQSTIVTVPKKIWGGYSAEVSENVLKTGNVDFYNHLIQVSKQLMPNSPAASELLVKSSSLAIGIMAQLEDTQASYISLLIHSSQMYDSSAFPHPLLFDEKYMKCLRGSQAYHAIELRQKMFRYLAEKIFPTDKSDQQTYLWAISTILSRALSGSDRPFSLVPLLDFANHSGSTEKQNIEHAYSSSQQDFSLITTRNIKEGEELCLTYGLNRDSVNLLALYGIVDLSHIDNGNDKINVLIKAQPPSPVKKEEEMEDIQVSAGMLKSWKMEQIEKLQYSNDMKGSKLSGSVIAGMLSSLSKEQIQCQWPLSQSEYYAWLDIVSPFMLEKSALITSKGNVSNDSTYVQEVFSAKKDGYLAVLAKVERLLLRIEASSSLDSSLEEDDEDADNVALTLRDFLIFSDILRLIRLRPLSWQEDLGYHSSRWKNHEFCLAYVTLFGTFFQEDGLLCALRLVFTSQEDISLRLSDCFTAEDLERISPLEKLSFDSEEKLCRQFVAILDEQLSKYEVDSNTSVIVDKYITSLKHIKHINESSEQNDRFQHPMAYWSEVAAPFLVGREYSTILLLREMFVNYWYSLHFVA